MSIENGLLEERLNKPDPTCTLHVLVSDHIADDLCLELKQSVSSWLLRENFSFFHGDKIMALHAVGNNHFSLHLRPKAINSGITMLIGRGEILQYSHGSPCTP